MLLNSINPANGEILQSYPETLDPFKVLELVHEGYKQWRRVSFQERAKKLKQIADLLRARQGDLARLMSLEMGKPITQSRLELEKCAWVCEYYAEHAEPFLAPEAVTTNAKRSFVTFNPLGVVLAVMPWNFPFWQVFRFSIPALMAGNAVLLKHAPNVSGCALEIEKIFAAVKLPQNLFRSILIPPEKVDAVVSQLIESPFVQAVTLTGSTRAGKVVAAKAASCIKKSVLELGGSDPFIVLADADLELAVELGVKARLSNGGQSCIAAKRFIVVEEVREKFQSLFVEKMQQKKMGDPLQTDTDIGPQARLDLRDQLHQQVRKSVEKGAKILLGGEIPKAAGFFYPATVLAKVQKGMPAYEEEIFGPVASIISARDEQAAIRIANDTKYGLGAAIFTRNLDLAEKIACEELQAGSCFINSVVQSDPRLPFGGIKESGYGRELSIFGIREFVNIKTVSIT